MMLDDEDFLTTIEYSDLARMEAQLTDFRSKPARRTKKPSVYIQVDGHEYKVRMQDSKSLDALIEATDPAAKQKDRLKYLDIRGLGYLKYVSRVIKSSRKSTGRLEYILKCKSKLEY